MERLPLELVETILSNEIISVQDVINFSSTCSYYRSSILNNSQIWKSKFYNKWPHLANFFSKPDIDYLEEIQYVYELKLRTITLLEVMPPRFYKKYQLSDTDLEEWSDLIKEKDQTYYYLVAQLMDIVNVNEAIKSIEVVPLNTPGNKTLQYYANKVLRFLKQLHLTKEWTDYTNLPLKKQLLERGATFVAQWCQPELDITQKKIENQLDCIANLVKQKLLYNHPDHAIFRCSSADLEAFKYENLEKSMWSTPECRLIIETLRQVMYSDLGFGGNTENYYMPQNSLINKVLETRKGLPIILAIIYSSVGRRLGLLFEPINFPAHFLLRFVETNNGRPTVYYIDTFNGGNVMQKTVCPYSAPVPREVLFPVATPGQVVERIVNNLELSTRQHNEPNGRVTYLRSILELLILVNPQDLSAAVSLAKLYTLHKINTKALENYLISQRSKAPEQVENILVMLRSFARHHVESELEFHTENPVAKRTADLKYAVGMVMTDITNSDKCVIYAWNSGTSSAEASVNAQWPSYSLLSRPKQPFYNVLVEDGSYRYVPQEALIPCCEVGSLHLNKDLGRHFSHFFENHFVPNAEKEKEYPSDSRIRHKYYHEMQLSHYKP